MALSEHRPLDNIYVEHIASVVKIICKQYIKHFSYDGFIEMFDNLTSDEFNDSFKVITKKIEIMNSKLLGSLQYKLRRVVPQSLVIVWQDSLFRLHAVFYGNEFLNSFEQEIIKTNTREILIHNRKNNRNYSYTCLSYELRKQENYGYTLHGL